MYGWPPVLLVWIQLLCKCGNDNILISLVESKPVKQEKIMVHCKGKYHCMADLLFYFFCNHLLCICWINHILISLVESKPVKHEVSRTVILPLIMSEYRPMKLKCGRGRGLVCNLAGSNQATTSTGRNLEIKKRPKKAESWIKFISSIIKKKMPEMTHF